MHHLEIYFLSVANENWKRFFERHDSTPDILASRKIQVIEPNVFILGFLGNPPICFTTGFMPRKKGSIYGWNRTNLVDFTVDDAGGVGVD